MISNKIKYITFSNEYKFIYEACRIIFQCAEAAIKNNGIFRISLSGGDTPQAIYSQLINFNETYSYWNLWEVWFVDERLSRSYQLDSNQLMIKNIFLNLVDIPNDNIHWINLNINDDFKILDNFNTSLNFNHDFDCIILGIGEDGHTASLFPGNDLQYYKLSNSLLITNSPKPPKVRISTSLDRINRSNCVLFLAKGAKKKDIVNKYLNGVKMPARNVNPKENLYFLYCDN
jgi:6-phosphogluconolactonase